MRAKLRITSTKILAISNEILISLQRQLALDSSDLSLVSRDRLRGAVATYHESARVYIAACEHLLLFVERFSRSIPARFKNLLLEIIRILSNEISFFTHAVCRPLEFLMSGQAEHTFLTRISCALKDKTEHFQQFLKGAFIFICLLTIGLIVLFSYFLFLQFSKLILKLFLLFFT